LSLATKHSLRNILDRLLVVIQTCARKLTTTFGPEIVHRPGYRQALIEASIVTNAALAAYSIQEGVRTKDAGELRAVYGVYLLETREVWAPRPGDTKTVGLAAAPNDLAGFVDLGAAIVRSERIARILR
jgi:carbonic anhydrase